MLGCVNCVKTDRAERAGASGTWSLLLLLRLKTISFVYFEPRSQPTVFGEVSGIEQGIKSPVLRSASLRRVIVQAVCGEALCCCALN